MNLVSDFGLPVILLWIWYWHQRRVPTLDLWPFVLESDDG